MKRICCHQCMRPLPACLCAALPPQAIANQWPVYILQHHQEAGHALNTARIAALGLTRCKLVPVTDTPVEAALPAELLADLASAWLIYPGKESRTVAALTAVEIQPRPLLVLDASWRKSRRMLLASPWLQTLPCVSFNLQTPSRYRIRKEPAPNYCSTLEALCLVLGELEQNPQKYAPLLATMDVMVDQQIAQMGEATFRRNY